MATVEKTQLSRNVFQVVKFVIKNIFFIPIFKMEMGTRNEENVSILLKMHGSRNI